MLRRTALFAAAIFAALGGLGIASASAAELTFSYNDPDAPDLRAALDLFEKQNPGIKVTLERGDWASALTAYLREAAVGSGPDVAQTAFVWVKDLATAGAVLPLDQFTKPQKATQALSDFIALDLGVGKDGKVYGLPWTVDTFAMVYNTTLLKQAGIESIPKTWEEFRDAAQKVHQLTGKSGFLYPFGSAPANGIWFAANYWWWSHGQALVVSKPDSGYGLGLNAADIVADINYFNSFLKDGITPRSMLAVSNWGDPAVIEPMVAGDALATMVPPANFKQIMSEWKGRHPDQPPPFVSALVPAASAGSITHLGGRMLVINANTKNPDEAWKLVQFLASQKVFQDFYRSQFPAQKSLLKDIDFGPGMQGYAQQLEHARTWGPYSDGPVQISTMWNEVGRDFGAVFIGQATPDESAQRILTMIQQKLK